MEDLFTEIFLIAILILLNGYLSGTEIAVVTARKSHIKQMAESGKMNEKGVKPELLTKSISFFTESFKGH